MYHYTERLKLTKTKHEIQKITHHHLYFRDRFLSLVLHSEHCLWQIASLMTWAVSDILTALWHSFLSLALFLHSLCLSYHAGYFLNLINERKKLAKMKLKIYFLCFSVIAPLSFCVAFQIFHCMRTTKLCFHFLAELNNLSWKS